MSEAIMTWDNIKAVLLFSWLFWAPRLLIAVVDAMGKVADAAKEIMVNRDQCRRDEKIQSKQLDTAKDIVQMYGNRAGPVQIPGVLELDTVQEPTPKTATPTEHPRDPPPVVEPAVPVVPSCVPKSRKSRSELSPTPSLFE